MSALVDCYPPFAERCRALEAEALTQGVPIRWTAGWRAWAEQQRLWEQGRDARGVAIRPEAIVTNARAGESWHQYGLAADFGLLRPDGSSYEWSGLADLDADGVVDWLEVGRLAERCGLVWGGRWTKLVDLPHVQWRMALLIPDAIRLYQEGGLASVWVAVARETG